MPMSLTDCGILIVLSEVQLIKQECSIFVTEGGIEKVDNEEQFSKQLDFIIVGDDDTLTTLNDEQSLNSHSVKAGTVISCNEEQPAKQNGPTLAGKDWSLINFNEEQSLNE